MGTKFHKVLSAERGTDKNQTATSQGFWKDPDIGWVRIHYRYRLSLDAGSWVVTTPLNNPPCPIIYVLWASDARSCSYVAIDSA